MKLPDNEIRDITSLLEGGKPLPDKYRFMLFGDEREIELVWNGKSQEITNVVLPFQTIEHVDEPRAEESLRGADLLGGGKDELIKYVSARIISNIGYLTGKDSTIYAEIPICGITRLSKLQYELESGSTFKEACEHLHIPDKLLFNKDYFGQGTEVDPITFRDGLFYHEAFFLFCNQNNIVEKSYCPVEIKENCFLYKLTTEEDINYFFLVAMDEYERMSE